MRIQIKLTTRRGLMPAISQRYRAADRMGSIRPDLRPAAGGLVAIVDRSHGTAWTSSAAGWREGATSGCESRDHRSADSAC